LIPPNLRHGLHVNLVQHGRTICRRKQRQPVRGLLPAALVTLVRHSDSPDEDGQMSVKVTFHQLQDQLTELLDQVVKNGDECVVQRDGKDCAVIVNIRQWRRRAIGQRLDALGPAYRLSGEKQARAEHLLAAKTRRSLLAKERQELKSLLREGDAILLRRAAAMDRK